MSFCIIGIEDRIGCPSYAATPGLCFISKMVTQQIYGYLSVALICLFSCTSVNYRERASLASEEPAHQLKQKGYRQKVEHLIQELAALNHGTETEEARMVAETSIRYSMALADAYRLIRPAIVHNMLVQLGLRDRGLCYHWTEDLMERLQALPLKSYQLHWGVAYRGSDLREHNTVVITVKGQEFKKGIVLDPWRNSGDLYWVSVGKDRYPWRELPPEDW